MVRWIVGSILHGGSIEPYSESSQCSTTGVTYSIYSYILKKDPPPQCERCQCILTVRHILVECNHLAWTRNDIFGRCCVVESFQFHPEFRTYAPSHRQDSTYLLVIVTSWGALAGTRNSSMGPPWGIDPMTRQTMSRYSTSEPCLGLENLDKAIYYTVCKRSPSHKSISNADITAN